MKIIRAYRPDGSATQDPKEIKDFLASTDNETEFDIESPTGVKATTLGKLRGTKVKVGESEVEVA